MFTGQERIDCILVADGTDAELFRALSSVAVQSVAADVEMTIVEMHGREGDAKKVAEAFGDFASIRVLEGGEKEGFPQCWQRGLDATHAPLVLLLRAMQTLNGPFVLQTMRWNWRQAPETAYVIGSVNRQSDLPGVYAALELSFDNKIDPAGKLYSRSALEKSGARFYEEGDDSVFVFGAVLMLGTEDWQALTMGDVACCHHVPEIPAVKEKLPPAFSYARRMGKSVSCALETAGEATFKIARFALDGMAGLYRMHLMDSFTGENDPGQSLAAARIYYARAFSRCEPVIPPEAIEGVGAAIARQLPPPAAEKISFAAFIALLRQES